jgi:hypothetical protein
MIRIIYFIPELGYRTMDADTYEESLLLQEAISNVFADVICIVNFKSKDILNKCSDFQEHMDRIKGLLFEEDYQLH